MQSIEPYNQNNTPKTQERSGKLVTCHFCNTNQKAKTASMCRDCWNKMRREAADASRLTKSPNGFRKRYGRGGIHCDWCPSCGGEKLAKSSLCQKCRTDSYRTPVSNKIFFEKGKPYRLVGLTQNKAAIVDARHYEALSTHNWYVHRVGDAFYAACKVGSKLLHMHVEVARLEGWNPSRLLPVDHKLNTETLRNTVDNLRIANSSQSIQHTRLRRDSTTGYKGVSKYKNVKARIYRANIQVENRQVNLGRFDSAEEAARAYDKAAQQYFGEFAVLNFPHDPEHL